jgi:hypothetical protein
MGYAESIAATITPPVFDPAAHPLSEPVTALVLFYREGTADPELHAFYSLVPTGPGGTKRARARALDRDVKAWVEAEAECREAGWGDGRAPIVRWERVGVLVGHPPQARRV